MRIFCSCAVLLHLVAAQDPCDQARQPEGVVAGSKCLQPQGQWKHRFAAGARAARAYTLPNNRVGALVSGAKCPQVDATQLEDLWPEQHFRGPLQGPRQYFKRVPPHYLANHANISACRRRVYIDVGARDFEHGLREMFGWYPALGAFDEFYAFEAVAGFYKLPPPQELNQILGRYMSPERAATFARRHFFFQAFIGSRSDPSTVPPTLGLSDLLSTALQLAPSDMVVLKLDVEGYEYDVVSTLLDDGTHALIDEMMVEVHYGHPRMTRMFNWCSGMTRAGAIVPKEFWCNYTLADATDMYQALRKAGVYAHHWP